MQKLFIVITFICFSLATTAAHRGEQRSHGRGDRFLSGRGNRFPLGRGNRFPFGRGNRFPLGSNTNKWASQLCANSSLAQAFLSKNQAVFTQLNSNGSFAQFLQQKAQQVAYIQNSANAALLSSNCTQYFIGLTTAQYADMQKERQQQEYENIATRLVQQIIPTIFGYGSGRY
ncbi:unnamed protein product [Rotaria magnacalcarata]|uniref:SXP/RAL-2 family protein Ani s 5-like cation-binding domain-containing protein n=1 Tax=Rotaria magnacalcarata TaxID=392030 RepID=A0A815YQS8_9BILA|nr:unnamed protein product [Rotaria magnacalcarata]CAF1621325.1 unnamed protein product [Rotaria magnacalcarata]CAF2015362.1 unnamed protein product [Rotaria magnacalcarata]CAF4071715.1 unnamed protein product [Rotaria magnacalcarata]CAF4180834.1 unnamed protein product [Rotaria magnacalcarata]